MMGGLPRRDLWLLPLVAGVTLVLLLGGAELTARALWPERSIDSCRTLDPIIGYRYRPHCSSVTKAAEGPWVRNDYNACGYRSATPCGPVPPGVRRIALVGTSLSEGYLVAYAESIGARLAAELSASCGAPVEVQNLGNDAYRGERLVRRFREALALRPDAVLLLLSVHDIEEIFNDPLSRPAAPGAPEPLRRHLWTELKRVSADVQHDSRAIEVLKHFLFQDPGTYTALYLRNGDKADFLRPPFTAAWRDRMNRFDQLLAEIAASAEGTPVILAFAPQQAQLDLMSRASRPPGVDPRALPEALAAIARRHGIRFIDTSDALALDSQPQLLFYRADGHPAGRAHGIMAHEIAAQLVGANARPFAGCARLRTHRAVAR